MIYKNKTTVILIALSTVSIIIGLMAGFIIEYKYYYTKSNINDNLNQLNLNTNKTLFYYLLLQNLRLIALLVVGSLVFGSTTFVNLVANGLNFSILIILANFYGINLKNFIVLTLPHAIFEIPAIIIAGAAGFKIPCEIVRYLAGKKETILTKEDVKEYLTLALISVVLIVIAAWIEANVTLNIAKAMLNSTKGT